MNNASTEETVEENGTSKALAKKLKRAERKNERERERLQAERKRKVGRALPWLVPLLVVTGLIWFLASAGNDGQDNNHLISAQGIHWHSDLTITVKGQPVTIPANIGLHGMHADTHTHKENDQIHLEINRPTRKNDLRLGNFFDTWEQTFNSECILDSCNGPNGSVRMFVNGEENFEFENYLMKDRDQIEIRYE